MGTGGTTTRSVRLRALALAIMSAACNSLGNCPAGKPDITVDSGTTDRDAGIYYSAPPWGPRVPYPAKTTLHFIHDLGFTPLFPESFVSFTAEGSDESENAGNQARWKCIDDHEIVIENDTCEDFYISVKAHGPDDLHNPCSCAEQAAGECPKR
jgi:hypothetical protein